MISLPDKNNFAVTNQRCLKLRGYAQGGFFSANFAQIGPPQAHLPLSAELIGAHSDFIKFHLTFEFKIDLVIGKCHDRNNRKQFTIFLRNEGYLLIL